MPEEEITGSCGRGAILALGLINCLAVSGHNCSAFRARFPVCKVGPKLTVRRMLETVSLAPGAYPVALTYLPV